MLETISSYFAEKNWFQVKLCLANAVALQTSEKNTNIKLFKLIISKNKKIKKIKKRCNDVKKEEKKLWKSGSLTPLTMFMWSYDVIVYF